MADAPIDDRPAALATLVHELRAEVAELRSRLDAATTVAAPSPSPATRAGTGGPRAATEAAERGLGRRRALLGLAGAAAAGTVAALAPGSPAAADDGDPVVLGADNQAKERTRLIDGGLSVIDGSLEHRQADGMVDALSREHPAISAWTDTGVTAVRADADGDGFGVMATSVKGTGLWARGELTGAIISSPFVGIYAEADDVGIIASGKHAAMQLQPEVGEPTDTVRFDWDGLLRMQRLDQESYEGALWLCVAAGEPGTWRKVAGYDTAGALHLLPAPARVYDSRPGGPPVEVEKGALPGGGATRTIDLKVNGSGVPAGATGALITVLVVNAPRGNGNLTLWAAGQPAPEANTMVWGGDAGRFTTLAMSALDDQARVQVATSTRAHLVLDVVGYYR